MTYTISVSDTYEAYSRTLRIVEGILAEIKKCEREYAIEKAKRIASGRKRSTPQESICLKQIKHYIRECRIREKNHNKGSKHPIHELDRELNDPIEMKYYPKTIELIQQAKGNMNNSSEIRKQIKEGIISNTEEVLAKYQYDLDERERTPVDYKIANSAENILANHFKESADIHAAIQSSHSTIGDILKNAPKNNNDSSNDK